MSQSYIPQEVIFDVKKDEQAFSKKVGFLTYKNDAGKIRQESVLVKWNDKKSNVKTFENVPRSGFILNRHIEHFSHNFNKDNIRFRVFFPECGGFEFEISALNLSYILSFCDISKGEIMSKCVFGWRNEELLLLPVDSQIYVEAQKNTSRQNNFDNLKIKNIDKENFQFGTVLQNKSGKFFIYLGKRKFSYYKDVEMKLENLNPDNFKLINDHLHFVYPLKEEHLVLPINTTSRGAHEVVNNVNFYRVANMKNLMLANCTTKELGIQYTQKEMKEEWDASFYRNGNASIFSFVNKKLSTEDLLVFDFIDNIYTNSARNFLFRINPDNKKTKLNILIASDCMLTIEATPVNKVDKNSGNNPVFVFKMMKNLVPWKDFEGTWFELLHCFNLGNVNNSYSLKSSDRLLEYQIAYHYK